MGSKRSRTPQKIPRNVPLYCPIVPLYCSRQKINPLHFQNQRYIGIFYVPKREIGGKREIERGGEKGKERKRKRKIKRKRIRKRKKDKDKETETEKKCRRLYF